MSRSNVFRLALVAALACSAAVADAKPRHIVVTDFDGLPRELADHGHTAVVTMLMEQYDVVATKRWEAARAKASGAGHGPQQWAQAAKAAGVDAVIEGWVQDEGKHHVLTVSVRDAMTGTEVDSVQVKIGDKGLNPQTQHQLQAQLEELLDFWVNADLRTPDPRLPTIDPGPAIGKPGGGTTGRPHGEDPDADDSPPPPRKKKVKKQRPPVDDDGEDPHPRKPKHVSDGDDDKPARAEQPADRAEKTKSEDGESTTSETTETEAPKKAKAPIVALDANPIEVVLTDDPDLIANKNVKHTPRKTPRVELLGGMFIQSRGMSWNFDPNAQGGPPSYPASGLQGASVQASVYPWPWKKYDGKMSGIGFSVKLNKAIGSSIDVQDDSGYGTYEIDHVAWEVGVHYRFPIHELIAIDTELSYGSFNHMLPSDFPSSIEIPDTAYQYLGAGVHVDLYLTDRATVGVGAKYQLVTSAGDMTSEDWYGSGSTNGLSLDADFRIPLPYNLFLRGAIEWRRYFTDFQGSGVVTMNYGVWDVTDTSITGTAQLGIHF